MRKSQRSKVTGGKVVDEGYLHISGDTPIKLIERNVAEMAPEDHAVFHDQSQLGQHHQMAGVIQKQGADRSVPFDVGHMDQGPGGGTSCIEGHGLASHESGAVEGYK